MTIMFLWVGLLFLGVGLVIFGKAAQERSGTVRLRGRLAGYTKLSSPFHAVVEFPGVNGQTRYVISEFGSSAPLGYVGQEKSVFARRSDPNHAVVDSRLTFILGLVFATMGAASIAVFIYTFQWNFFSIAIAGLVTLSIGSFLVKAVRKIPLTAEKWQALKGTKQRVYTCADKDKIPWIEPSVISTQAERSEKQRKWGVPIALALSCTFFFLSHYLYQRTTHFLKTAQPASGVVVRMIANHGSDSTTFAPQVEFAPPGSSERVRFTHSISSNPPAYSVGEKVKVLFNPANPRDATIDLGVWSYWGAVLAGGAALLCLFIGLLYALGKRTPTASNPRSAVA